MKIQPKKTGAVALLTGAIMAASSLLPMTAAHADKSKTYKVGAIALGAASAYMILKGKTVPGIVAGAGALYAYKKSQDAKRDQNYARYPASSNGQYPTYSQYPDNNGNAPYYDGSSSYPAGQTTDQSYYPDNNSGYYPSSNYPNSNGGSDPNDNGGTYQNSGGGYYDNGGGYSRDNQSASTGAYPDYGYRAFQRGNHRHGR